MQILRWITRSTVRGSWNLLSHVSLGMRIRSLRLRLRLSQGLRLRLSLNSRSILLAIHRGWVGRIHWLRSHVRGLLLLSLLLLLLLLLMVSV